MAQEPETYGSMGSLDAHLLEAETNLREDDQNQNPLIETDDANSLAANVGNVDKIRDILFGTQQRDYEKRFKRLEERFSKDNMHLRDDMTQKIKSLEELINGEIDSLGQRVSSERQERTADVQNLQHEINMVKNELTNRLAQLDEQFSKDLKLFRQQTHSNFKEISLQIRQGNESLTNTFKTDVAQLQEDKVNRSDLAAFFSEFSLRLNRNFSADTD